VRGDTIDVFPAEHAELAVRIELFDDEIDSLQLFDPLTGRVRQKIPRFTVYPSSHYVTPRETVLRAIEDIKEELRERLDFFYKENKLVEAQRLEQRTRFDLEMLPSWASARASRTTRAICRARSRASRRRRWSTTCRRRADVPRRIHVLIGQFNGMYNGDRAQDHAGRIRLPPALGAGQPAAQVRRVRAQDAPGGVRLGHAGDYEKEHAGPGGRAGGAADRPGRPDHRVRPPPRRWTTCWEIHQRVEVNARAGHHADQAHGRAADRIPGRKRRQGALPALGHRHRRARGDHPRPAPGHVRRAGGHQPAARGLDIPEVSLVAILDADKEGFLRAERS
jgi:excinuclease ABC subunit B